MKHIVRFLLFIVMFLFSLSVSADSSSKPEKRTITISMVNNLPLSIDRLIYTAFEEMDYKADITPIDSLHMGCEQANIGEKDGVMSAAPNMELLYPNLVQVPVALEKNSVQVFVRDDSRLLVKTWEDLAGLKVCILSQNVDISGIPVNAEIITKDTATQIMTGLLNFEYDAAVLSQRSHETLSVPKGLKIAGTAVVNTEYLYLHKSKANLVDEAADALNKLFADGRGDKILNDTPIPEMYSKKTVLHLISSSTEIDREDQLKKSLHEQFKDVDSIEWYSVALYSRRFSDDHSRLSYFANILRRDSVSRNIAAIVVSGNDALDFLKQLYYPFYRNVPVFFYGINEDYSEKIIGYEDYFTGIVEQLSAFETVSSALELFPKTENILVINDYTSEGSSYRKVIEDQLKLLPSTITVTYNDYTGREVLLEQINRLPDNSLVFVGSYFKDSTGQYYTLNEMKRTLESTCDVPIFSTYSTDVPYGAIGGKFLDYEKYGLVLADMIKRILIDKNDISAPVFSDDDGCNRWVFNSDRLNEWNIKESELPIGSQIINKPPPIWETNPAFVYVSFALLVLALLLGTLALISRKNKNELRKVEEEHQKRHIEVLRQSSAIMDNLDELIYAVDPDYNLIYMNKSLLNLYEAEQHDIVGKKCWELAGNGIMCANCPIDDLKNMEGGVSSIVTESFNADIDKWLMIKISIIKWVDGFPVYLSAGTDISIRKEHEKQVERHAEEINHALTILDNLDEVVYVIDSDFSIIYANQLVTDMFKIHFDDIIGKKCWSILGDDKPCDNCIKINGSLNKGDDHTRTFERFFPSINRWLSIRTSIIRWVDGRHVQLFSGIDITAHKEDERLKELHAKELAEALIMAENATKAKSSFLANMSHEIRTPMNSIIGFSELALNDVVPFKTKDYLEKIKVSAEGLLQIINDILDISKIEAGKVELESIPFDIGEVFSACQIIIAPKATEKGISLFCYAEPSIGKLIIGDPTKLRQALLNLLSNAVKFTNSGMVKLLSAITKTDGDWVSMSFEVKDSGIGMTPDRIKKIFEPFVQADESTTRKYGGTGLGLTITKNIIELMGGELHVESVVGAGSRFSFELTFKTTDSTACRSLIHRDLATLKKPLFTGEILVFEDNTMNQQVICEHLYRVGLMPTVAINGKEGVKIVEERIRGGEKPFELIFMDIHMPVMDGLEAAKRLESMGCTSPIVALTANIMPSDRELYSECGMQHCMVKPFSQQELWGCLIQYIEPVTYEDTNAYKNEDDEKLRNKLLMNFVHDYTNAAADLSEAEKTGDIKYAHRLAHSIKGSAGLIGRPKLQEAAFEAERSLSGEKAGFVNVRIDSLKNELNSAIAELEPVINELKMKEPKPQSGKKPTKSPSILLDELKPLLESGDSSCIDMIDELGYIAGTETLITHIENYDFQLALKELDYVQNYLHQS